VGVLVGAYTPVCNIELAALYDNIDLTVKYRAALQVRMQRLRYARPPWSTTIAADSLQPPAEANTLVELKTALQRIDQITAIFRQAECILTNIRLKDDEHTRF
jgi:hypothetical protein